MKNWYAKLTPIYKSTFVSFIAVIMVYLGLLFGYFINHPDIPNGLILGGGIGVISYLVLGIVDKRDEENNKFVLTIIVTILRYLLIAGAIVISALCQYKWGVKIFNVFSVVGGYLIPLVSFLVITLVERKNVR